MCRYGCKEIVQVVQYMLDTVRVLQNPVDGYRQLVKQVRGKPETKRQAGVHKELLMPAYA